MGGQVAEVVFWGQNDEQAAFQVELLAALKLKSSFILAILKLSCLTPVSDGEWFVFFVAGSFIVTFSVLCTLISCCRSRGVFRSLVRPKAGQAFPFLHPSSFSEAPAPNP